VLLNEGDGSFRARQDYRAAGRVRSIAIGDLNGDGKPDLATSNVKRISPALTQGTLSVFLARGDGSFAPRNDYRTAKWPISLALGDVNGDGKPDLVTASISASKVSVLLNTGDGSFPARRDYAAGRRPRSVALADLSGDGKLDVATAGDTSSVLLNRGDGRFPHHRDYGTGRRCYCDGGSSVATDDLNGDRRPELLVSTALSTVSVLVNWGHGRFQTWVDYPTARHPFSNDSGFPVSVASGDLNGDRRPDLVTANSIEDKVSVLINTPGLCPVQYVVYRTLPVAKEAIVRARCRVGKISRAYHGYVPKGLVSSQKPELGAVLPIGSKVNLVVSRGRRR
jgi:hypothetical protein